MPAAGTLRDRIGGALWGVSLGDAYGMPCEMWDRRETQAVFGKICGLLPGHPQNAISRGRAAGETTDDSAFTQLISDLLLEDGTVRSERLAERILAWLARGGEKSNLVLGPSTRQAIEAVTRGVPAEEAGKAGRTNGAAMRSVPLGIMFDYRDRARFAKEVRSASIGTHGTNVAMSAAGAVAAAVSCGVRGGSILDAVAAAERAAQDLDRFGTRVTEVSIAGRIETAATLLQDCRDDEMAVTRLSERIGTGLPAEESVPCAIGLAAYAGDDPMRCAVLAANLGGDTDTIGAMSCAICGAVCGQSAMDAADLAIIRRAGGIDWTLYIDEFTRRLMQANYEGESL